MISKAQIKIIQSLYQKKYRKQHNLFIVEGVKLTNELILSELNIHSIFATNEWISQNTNNETLKEFHYNINEISDEELKKISSLKTPNQVLALAQINDGIFDNKEENILLLDSIRNPGNLGTIIRIADWYNIKQIICSPDCVDVYNPKVVQSTMGSIFRVKIIYQELGEFIDNNNEYNYYNAELDGENIHALKFKKPTAIIIGNESTGVSDNLTKKVKNKISIPKYGNAESLNAAVATGIIFDNMLRLTSGDKNSKALQKNK